MIFKSKKEKPVMNDFSKDGFPNYIKKEIFMQPELIKNFVESHIKAGKINFDYLKIKTDKIRWAYIISDVENYSTALSGAYNFEVLCDIPAAAELISEFDCSNPVLDKSALVIAICSNSSVCEKARERAKRNSSQFVGIFDFSPEDKKSVSINFSKKAKVSTAGVTLRFTAITMLALYLGEKNQVITELYSRIAVDKLMTFGEKIKSILMREYDFRELGCLLKEQNLCFTGSNVDFAVSLYASYLFDCLTNNKAISYPLGAYHYFFDRKRITVFLASNSDFYSILENKNASLIFAPENPKNSKNVFEFSQSIPLLNPLILYVCIQLTAYFTADEDFLNQSE